MSIPEFAKIWKKKIAASNWRGHLLKLLQTAFFILDIYLYVCIFHSGSILLSTNLWDLAGEDVILVSLIILLDYGIDYLLGSFIFDPNSRKRKLLIYMRNSIWAVLMISYFCFDTKPHYLIRGNGWGIEIILLLITFLLWIGNNYYWNKQSEKYNWQ